MNKATRRRLLLVSTLFAAATMVSVAELESVNAHDHASRCVDRYAAKYVPGTAATACESMARHRMLQFDGTPKCPQPASASPGAAAPATATRTTTSIPDRPIMHAALSC